MGTALLLTGVALLYAGVQRSSRAAHPWTIAAGIALCGGGVLRAAASQGLGPGIASALVISMAALSLLSLVVPLSPRIGWALIKVTVVGLWLFAVEGHW